nr:hypothetical protein [Gemmatimonadaceae bacterium]
MRGLVVALDEVLVQLDRRDVPALECADDDPTGLALHQHATDRVLVQNIALRGVTVVPGAQGALDTLRAVAPLILVSYQSRAVVSAVVDATAWHDLFRAIVTGDDAPAIPARARW